MSRTYRNTPPHGWNYAFTYNPYKWSYALHVIYGYPLQSYEEALAEHNEYLAWCSRDTKSYSNKYKQKLKNKTILQKKAIKDR